MERQAGARTHWQIVLSLVVAALCWMYPLASYADCHAPYCTLATSQGVYPDFIIGTLTHIASSAELKQTFHWAKTHQHWQTLPNAFAPYAHDVLMATLTLSAKQAPMTVFIMRNEYDTAPLRVGDLVRYRPHGKAFDAPQDPVTRKLFYGLTGCIVTLCTKTDKTCFHGFQTGVFTLAGQQVNPATGSVLAGGTRIDPISLRPVTTPTSPERRATTSAQRQQS